MQTLARTGAIFALLGAFTATAGLAQQRVAAVAGKAAAAKAPAVRTAKSPAVITDYDARSQRCSDHPEADLVNCTAIKTADNTFVGYAKICPEITDSQERTRLETSSYNGNTLAGWTPKQFEQMGFCHSSDDETSAVLAWHWQNNVHRVYHDTKTREEKHIYVKPVFEDGTPEIIESAVRNELRRIPDLEITDKDEDFLLDITAFASTEAREHYVMGYALDIMVLHISRWPQFGGTTSVEMEYDYGNLIVMPKDGVNTAVAKVIAQANNGVFESFRKSWPYKH